MRLKKAKNSMAHNDMTYFKLLSIGNNTELCITISRLNIGLNGCVMARSQCHAVIFKSTHDIMNLKEIAHTSNKSSTYITPAGAGKKCAVKIVLPKLNSDIHRLVY